MILHHRFISLAAVIGVSSAPLFGAVTLPTWFGEANTTSQIFRFTSDDLTPAPETSSNPYGSASGVVDVGQFGNGWENPADVPISNPGHDVDGSWDFGMGSDGSLTFSIPVAPADAGIGQSYRIDLMIYAHVFVSLTEVPLPSVLGLASGDIELENQGVLSTFGQTGATWQYRTWTATIEDYTSGAITMALTAPSGDVSAVDRVEIYTRYTLVPEPTVPMLAVIPLAAWCLRRRRR